MEQLGLSQEGGAALSTSKSLTSFGEETFGSDSDMNRQDIASGGVAPIVARESVFKYHMSGASFCMVREMTGAVIWLSDHLLKEESQVMNQYAK